MSSIRERNGRWQARVTHEGKTFTKTFTLKADAAKWSRQQQVDMERGLIEPPRSTITLHDTLARYIKEVLPSKRGKQQELCILKAWQRRPIASLKLTEVKPLDVAAARDARLQEVATGSVRRELGTLSAVFTWCIKELQLCEVNPCLAIRKPPDG